jgi:hypothetical protein
MTKVIAASPEMSIFDLTRWKPITPAQYVDELGSCFLTGDDPEMIETKVDNMVANGTAFRLVTWATCSNIDGVNEPEVVPYLLVLFYPEGAKERHNLCFKRTDVTLAL